MMKTLQKLKLTVLMALVSASSYAYDFEVDGFYYDILSLDNMTCELVSGDVEYSGDIEIPSSVTYKNRAFSVISISASAFHKCINLTSVVINNGVVRIGSSIGGVFTGTFYQCVNLISVKIPNSVKEIGDNSFYGCTRLSSIDIPSSVWSIGHDAFNGCTSLKSIALPNGVSTIYENTFYECTNLSSVSMPSSLEYICDHAFYGCINLKSIKLHDKVTYIHEAAFNGCASLASVEMSNSLKAIEDSAFCGCESIYSIAIPSNVSEIGSAAFSNCTSLASVTLCNGVRNISSSAFDNCPKLQQMEVGDLYALDKMWGKTPTLIVAEDYNGVSFPNKTYSSYSNPDTIVCKITTPPTLYDTFSNAQYINLVVIVPTASLVDYQAADVWKKFWCLQGGAESYTTSGISTMIIAPSDKTDIIYDLNGRRLKEHQKGINIINGKKVLVK